MLQQKQLDRGCLRVRLPARAHHEVRRQRVHSPTANYDVSEANTEPGPAGKGGSERLDPWGFVRPNRLLDRHDRDLRAARNRQRNFKNNSFGQTKQNTT